MSQEIARALRISPAGTLELKQTATDAGWNNILPLFADGGAFHGGLTIAKASLRATPGGTITVVGEAAIPQRRASYHAFTAPVEASFSHDGQAVELELTFAPRLDTLQGAGSGLTFALGPRAVFRSNKGVPQFEPSLLTSSLKVGSVELSLRARWPDFMLEASLKHTSSKRLCEITREHFDASGVVPDGLELAELTLLANPWEGFYTFSAQIAGLWEIAPQWAPGWGLTGLSARVIYGSDGPVTLASFAGSLQIAGVPLHVRAAHSTNVSGWHFEGGTAKDQDIAVGELVESLAEKLGIPNVVPPALAGARLHELFASFNTVGKHFEVRCGGKLPIAHGVELDIGLVIDIERHATGSQANFHGVVKLGSLQFDLALEQKQGANGRSSQNETLFVAGYYSTTPEQVSLGDLIAPLQPEPSLKTAADGLSFWIQDALFVCLRDAGGTNADGTSRAAQTRWLLGTDLGGGVDLGGLPLVGPQFGPGQTARLIFQPLLASADFDAQAVDRVRALVPSAGFNLPVGAVAQGVSLKTKLELGSSTIDLSLPVSVESGAQAGIVHDASAPVEPPAGALHIDDVTWLAVQRAVGPLHVERVGYRYKDAALDFVLDANLSAGGITLGLEGLGASIRLAELAHAPLVPRFTLDGIGLDYQTAGMQIRGSFMRTRGRDGQGAECDEYAGTALIKTRALSLEAMGAYRTVDGLPSLFAYASLDYPIGGPSFFFVTGLAAALGYNRALRLPPIEQLADFPLIAKAPPHGEFRSALAALDEHIPPQRGAVFLGAGVKFSSFKIVESFALLTAALDDHLTLDLIGRSTLTAPAKGSSQPLAVVEMAWRASFQLPSQHDDQTQQGDQEGLLALRAQLTPASYVFSRACHLSGGFAFYSWFSGTHAGDFVATVGGYHPHFQKPDHYPVVPRLAFSWHVTDELSLKGDAYYALTASTAMLGGHLEAVWEHGPYKAWFCAGIDCFFAWKPVAYDAHAHVEVGASYTFQFAGTRHITAEVGADVHLWGPPFSGCAHVSLSVVSFDLAFGNKAPVKTAIGLAEFRASFLPDDNALCGVSVQSGLVRSFQSDKGLEWIVNPKELRLVADSSLPLQSAAFFGTARFDGKSAFGVAPMGAASTQVTSSAAVTIKRVSGSRTHEVLHDAETHFVATPRDRKVPVALWGESLELAPHGQRHIDALSGLTIGPAGEPDCGVSATWPDASAGHEAMMILQRHRPVLPAGSYDIKVQLAFSANSERLELKSKELPSVTRRFHVAGEQVELSAAAVSSVYPPRASLGDHAATLAHIILERSTLPWERSAEQGKDTPWLALVVFSDDEKPTPTVLARNDFPTREAFQVALEDLGLPTVDFPDASTRVSVITVDTARLPAADQLALLCHVRKVGDVERAVVVANRPPEPNKRSTVHLVSLEQRYSQGKPKPSVGPMRLVSLYSWSFSSGAESFANTLSGLVKGPFRLPIGASSKEHELEAGYVPLQHVRRDGTISVASYRSPLVPAGSKPASDTISYAAARELGRLLTLQNKAVSVGLLRWKRSLSQHRIRGEQRAEHPHLYPDAHGPAAPAPSLPKEVADWFARLRLLDDVPFRYLLPDERLLPLEATGAVRCFEVDTNWAQHLLDGAASVGGPGAGADPAFTPKASLCGVLVRSSAVSDFPNLVVTALDSQGKRVPSLKTTRLASSILFALFDRPFHQVAFSLPMHALHFSLASERAKDFTWDKPKDSVELAKALLATVETVTLPVGA